jgi:hypothetical protein
VDDQTQPTGRRYAGASEIEAYQALVRQLKSTPIPDRDILANLGLFLTRSSFGRLQFNYKLYQRILDVHGVVMEFGTWWGQNLALFSTFRSLHEPYNLSRRIIGFDTFAGFPGVVAEDGRADVMREGAFALPDDYQDRLAHLLGAHEALAPRGEHPRFELIKGDVEDTLPAYLERHPETVIALAYFDLDLYRPTRTCLEAIRPYLARNSVLAFDQLCFAEFPGESLALREALSFDSLRICRDPISPIQSYVVFE